MSYPLYLFLGLAPSVIWLLFFLRKDAHPESNRMILKIFAWGMAITIPAVLLERGAAAVFSKFIEIFSKSGVSVVPFLMSVLYIFIGVALVEEILKYLVVKWKVLNNPEFDEPLDAMLYMIIAALGFAGIENILVLFTPEKALLISEASTITALRFIGATFLHALTSGTIGYFLARSFFEPKKGRKLLLTGFTLAIGLHGLFNLSIIKIGDSLMVQNGKLLITNFQLFLFSSALLLTILISLAFFVSLGFKRLKKLASVCKAK